MTDDKMFNSILEWVKVDPGNRINLLRVWRKNLKREYKVGRFDPIHDVPSAGDNAYMNGHGDMGKIEYVVRGEALVTYEPTDFANSVPVDKMTRNTELNAWTYNEEDAERD